MIESKIIDKDYNSSFQAQLTDSDLAALESLKKNHPELFNFEGKLFGAYLRIKVILVLMSLAFIEFLRKNTYNLRAKLEKQKS